MSHHKVLHSYLLSCYNIFKTVFKIVQCSSFHVKPLLPGLELTLKRPGGGDGWINPLLNISATTLPREFFLLRRSLTSYFEVSRISWHHFRENRAYRCDATWLYIHARRTQNGLKTWFCVQSQCKWSFLTIFIKIWLFSLSLAEINLF